MDESKEENLDAEFEKSDDAGEEFNKEHQEEIKKAGVNYNQSAPFYQQTKKKSNKLLFLFIALVILAAAGFIFKHQIKSWVIGNKLAPAPAPTSAPTPAPTPVPNPLIRSDWSLEVLNGTTTPGLAKKAADKLKELGYPVVKTGNADKQNYTSTQILVKQDLLSKVDLVVADLKDIVKIASVGGQLKDSTASARIILGKE